MSGQEIHCRNPTKAAFSDASEKRAVATLLRSVAKGDANPSIEGCQSGHPEEKNRTGLPSHLSNGPDKPVGGLHRLLSSFLSLPVNRSGRA